MYLDNAKYKLENLNPKIFNKLIGCSQNEIIHLENEYNITLPKAYLEYLIWFGKSDGIFYESACGDYFYYDTLVTRIFDDNDFAVRNGFETVLLEYGLNAKDILENCFVFFNHQFYYYEFFYLNESEDPKIFMFMVNEKKEDAKIVKLFDSFSNYIENLVETKGKPRESIYVIYKEDLENNHSYDDCINELSFNGSVEFQNKRIPDRVFDFLNLKKLDLRYMKLLEISSRISELQNLKLLNLNGNHISELNTELFNLINLEILYLNNNNISTIPFEISKLKNLKEITLDENNLSKNEISKLYKFLPNKCEITVQNQKTSSLWKSLINYFK